MKKKLIIMSILMSFIIFFSSNTSSQTALENSVSNQSFDISLINHWSFNDGDARDYSGNQNDGRIVGADITDGIFGYGIEITDTEYISSIPQTFDDSINFQMTFSCWIYWYGPHSYNIKSYVFDCREDAWDGGGFILRIYDDGSIQFLIRELDEHQVVESESVLTEHTWTHIVTVFDQEKQEFSMFINGAKDNSSIPYKQYKDTKYNACIGNNHWAPNDNEWCPFNGIIDEIRIYNRALSSSEILGLFINPGDLHYSIIDGKINNLQTTGNIITFHAERIRAITFSPFQFIQYRNNERITISSDYIGILNPNTICAYCKSDV